MYQKGFHNNKKYCKSLCSLYSFHTYSAVRKLLISVNP